MRIEPPGGIYRVLSPIPDIVATLSDSGWRVGVAAESHSTDEFYAVVAAALQFPDWFGRNLDALWDCLTDLTEPTALVLARWSTFARARPERWTRILGVLEDRTEQQPPFAVFLC